MTTNSDFTELSSQKSPTRNFKEGEKLISGVATLYYLKFPVFQKSYEACKERRKYGPSTGEKYVVIRNYL